MQDDKGLDKLTAEEVIDMMERNNKNHPRDLDGLPDTDYGHSDLRPKATEGSGNTNSAPDPIKVAEQRTIELVHNICTSAQLKLRERRDEIDNLIARMSESEAAINRYIHHFTTFSVEVIAMCSAIEKEIAIAAMPFEGKPPATLTQEK